MKKSILLFAMLCTAFFATLAASLPVPNPDFESAEGTKAARYLGEYRRIDNQAQSGKGALQQFYTGGPWDCIQMSAPFIPCKPDSWYRLTIWNRNTVPSGSIYFGVRQCVKASADTDSISFNWANVKPNSQEWSRYSLEFKTSGKTNALSIYFRIGEDVSAGEVFWDNIQLESFEKIPPPFTVKPLASVVTYVDTPSEGCFVAPGQPYNMQWRPIDPAEKMAVEYSTSRPGAVMRMSMNQNGGANIWTREFPAEKASLQYYETGISTLGAGYYTLNMELIQNGKTVMKEVKNIVRLNHPQYGQKKLPPIHQVQAGPNRNLLVDGLPFMPILFSHMPMDGDYYQRAQTQFGMNFVPVWHDVADFANKTDEQIAGEYIAVYRKKLDLCLENNQYGTATLYRSGILGKGTLNLAVIGRIVDALKDHPALFCWDLVDEPELYHLSKELMNEAYQLIRTKDPKHPVWTNLCMIRDFKKYSECSDIASFDHYPFPAEALQNQSNWNRTILDVFPKDAPFISYLQVYNPENIAMPTFAELRALHYMNIVDGARSMVVYSWSDALPAQSMATDIELQGYVKVLAAEITALSSRLQAASLPNFAPVLPEQVRFLALDGLLILVNLDRAQAADAMFSLPGVPAIRGLFTHPGVLKPTAGGVFKLKLAPLDVRIFTW